MLTIGMNPGRLTVALDLGWMTGICSGSGLPLPPIGQWDLSRQKACGRVIPVYDIPLMQ